MSKRYAAKSGKRVKSAKRSYRGVKLPKCNGRPQVWLRGIGLLNIYEQHSSLRIIYPSGRVQFENRLPNEVYAGKNIFQHGCTSCDNQESAIVACIDYDLDPSFCGTRPIFVGYI